MGRLARPSPGRLACPGCTSDSPRSSATSMVPSGSSTWTSVRSPSRSTTRTVAARCRRCQARQPGSAPACSPSDISAVAGQAGSRDGGVQARAIAQARPRCQRPARHPCNRDDVDLAACRRSWRRIGSPAGDRSPSACRSVRSLRSLMITMRSASVIASTWSCVTKIIVVLSCWCSCASSIRVRARRAASRLESGSSNRNSEGLLHDRAGDRRALPLAAGKLARAGDRASAVISRRCAAASIRCAISSGRHAGVAAARRPDWRGSSCADRAHNAGTPSRHCARREAGDRCAGLRPGFRPPSSCSSPAIMRSRVDFPQPEGPEEHQKFARRNVERQPIDHQNLAVTLGYFGKIHPRHSALPLLYDKFPGIQADCQRDRIATNQSNSS